MIVIVVENVPANIRGHLAVWLLELRAGVYVGSLSMRQRDYLWDTVLNNIESGNVVMAWNTNTESGFEFRTSGENRRIPRNFDGMQLIAFEPKQSNSDESKISIYD